MEFRNVSTQKELAEAITNGYTPVCVGQGFFTAPAGKIVLASDSAHVRAWGSARTFVSWV